MAEIVYKSLSSLSPIELKYQYHRNEELQASVNSYQEGYSFYEVDGLNDFQDVAINKDSVFVLTPTVELSSVFTSTNRIDIGKIPGSIILQPRKSMYYISFYDTTSTFNLTLTLTSASIFYVAPIEGTNEVELFVNKQYVQVNATYPYTVYLNDKSLNSEEIQRQRFEVVYQNNFITFKTKTDSGYRYLAFNNDNTLRAVGLILNDSVVNDYIFNCIPVTTSTINRGFNPTNNWITYYFDVESETENKTVTINKNFANNKTNLLIDFPLEQAAETGTANINIANLKTAVTPSGAPAPVNNAYTKNVITTN